MRQEKAAAASPFSALTYQEQQDRWMEWRSRQLDYRPSPGEGEAEARPAQPVREERPRLRNPNMPIAAPYQRRELNQVLRRHQKALLRAGAFQPTAIDQTAP